MPVATLLVIVERHQRQGSPVHSHVSGFELAHGSKLLVARRGSSEPEMAIGPAGELVCIMVYKRGAMEVVRRLRG